MSENTNEVQQPRSPDTLPTAFLDKKGNPKVVERNRMSDPHVPGAREPGTNLVSKIVTGFSEWRQKGKLQRELALAAATELAEKNGTGVLPDRQGRVPTESLARVALEGNKEQPEVQLTPEQQTEKDICDSMLRTIDWLAVQGDDESLQVAENFRLLGHEMYSGYFDTAFENLAKEDITTTLPQAPARIDLEHLSQAVQEYDGRPMGDRPEDEEELPVGMLNDFIDVQQSQLTGELQPA